MAELISDLAGPEVGVFAVNRNQEVVFWSQGASDLLGFAPQEMLGQHCLKANRCKQCMTGCGVASNGAIADIPLTLYRQDGTEVRVRKTARAFRATDGSFQGGIEVLVPEAVADARESDGLQARLDAPKTEDSSMREFHGLLSAAPDMLRAFDVIRNVAETDSTVLIRGESGTGKELAARAVHLESHRSDGPFLAVNCAALSPTLLQSELFGHVKGAFTGAVRERRGLFQQADGGTLFLDEVAELPMDLQAKLLRVLQERTVTPVGGTRSIAVDIRIVAATHRALRQKVQRGEFREDLMYRLRVVPIYLPPLRERRGCTTPCTARS